MVLRLENDWLWDFWLAREGADHHLFFLYSRRTPDDPDLRHQNAAIGHAVSTDLANWTLLPDAIHRGPTGSWDDATTWTGSVIETAEGWAMLYTGTSRAEDSLVQRIGLARSSDLIHWEKHPGNPVLAADPTWYELLDLDSWHDQAWRDPYLVHDVASGMFHAFVTARAASGPPEVRGVIGHATSPDLEQWTVLPPVTAPRGFGYMEIPQILQLGTRWHLLFSAPAWAQSGRADPLRVTGTFHAVADHLDGPYVEMNPLLTDAGERLYGGRLLKDGENLRCLSFRYLDGSGGFVGTLNDPMPVSLSSTSELVVAAYLSDSPGDGTLTEIADREVP